MNFVLSISYNQPLAHTSRGLPFFVRGIFSHYLYLPIHCFSVVIVAEVIIIITIRLNQCLLNFKLNIIIHRKIIKILKSIPRWMGICCLYWSQNICKTLLGYLKYYLSNNGRINDNNDGDGSSGK